MKSYNTLPEGYGEYCTVDLQKNHRTSLFVNLLSAAILFLMIIPMHFFVPITELFDMTKGLKSFCIRFGVILLLMILYTVFHELTHAVAMKICGTKKIKFGFTGLYAYAGSDDYYKKAPYIFIALAPVVLWGIVLGVVCLFVSDSWLWVIYIILAYNFSGAAGDLFVVFNFSRFPKDILIKDVGVSMTVYSKQNGGLN